MMDYLKQVLKRWLGVDETPISVEMVEHETPQKKEDAMSAQLEEFLKEGYDFRFNVLVTRPQEFVHLGRHRIVRLSGCLTLHGFHTFRCLIYPQPSSQHLFQFVHHKLCFLIVRGAKIIS